MDRADEALGELLRVTKPGGHVLLGVMSRHGALHAFLAGADAEIEEFGIDEMQAIYETGDLPTNHSSLGTPVHLFSWAELRALLERHACDVVVASAANFLSVGNDEVCERWRQDPEMWERFLRGRSPAARSPGRSTRDAHHRRRPRALTSPSTCGFHPFRVRG